MPRFSRLQRMSGDELLALTEILIKDMAERHNLEIGASHRKLI